MTCNIRKHTFRYVLPMIQISLCIHAVWSESSISTFWIAKDAKFFMQTRKTLIRLCQCAGWFESSLDAQVKRYVLCTQLLIFCANVFCLFTLYFMMVKFHTVYTQTNVPSNLFTLNIQTDMFEQTFWKTNPTTTITLNIGTDRPVQTV